MKNRILIVEDDHAISDAIALNMQFVGYEYAVFDDGKKAADSLADDHAYDLALLDIMLPGIDGFELFSYMERYNIPVIYITAKTDSASEIKGLMDGAEDYIVKPFDMLTLMVRIEKVLKRTGRLNTVYRVRDIELNSETRVVTKAGKTVELQPLEFDVLLMLLKNKNLTVSREQLLSDVWGYEYTGETVVLLSKGEIDSKKVRVEFSLEDMDMSEFQDGATYPQIKEYVLEHTGLKVSNLYISQIKRKCGLEVGKNYNLPKSEDSRQPQCPPEKEKAIREAFKYFGMI